MTQTADRFSGVLARHLPSDVEWAALLRPADDSLPLPPLADRSCWGTAEVTQIAEAAAAERGTPWPQPLASQAARVHRDGDREGWERPAFERQRRLTRAATMAAVTLDAAWIDEVADGVALLCEQSSWCWPAHDDSLERHDAVLAAVDDPFVDLGAGEAVAQLAWIDHLLGAALDEQYPGLRRRIRLEARRRIFDPFVTRRDWHWIGLDADVHNWNPWIHGNVLVAALRLLDDASEAATRAHIVALCVEGLDRYVSVLPDDGAIDEGYEYWWNGACRALEALDVLAHATGDSVRLLEQVPALRETVAFPHRMHLGGSWYLNLADGQARPVEPKNWHSLFVAAERVGDPSARAHALAQRAHDRRAVTEHAGTGRLFRALSDPRWRRGEAAASPLPATTWLPSVEVLLARPDPGSPRGLALAVKGGHNGEHHNHNDVGSIVVALDGVPVLVDAGRPTYTKQTFGPERYDIWTMQSEWHSVPTVAGRGQHPGHAFRARHAKATLSPAPALQLDIAAAYADGRLTSLERHATLEDGRVELRDSWRGDAPVTEHFVIAGDVVLVDGGALIQPIEGAGRLRLRWSGARRAACSRRPLDDPMLTSVWGSQLTRLEIETDACGSFTLTVEMEDTMSKDAA